MNEWTVGSSDRKHIDLQLKSKRLTFKEANRLRDQLDCLLLDCLLSDRSFTDCTKPRPQTGFIYPTDWKVKR